MQKSLKAAIIQNLEKQIKDLEAKKLRAIDANDTEYLPYWDGGIDAYRHCVGLLNSHRELES